MMLPETLIERAIVGMLLGWNTYVSGYAAELGEGRIGEDQVLGPEWAAIGHALHGLLNGPTGKRLDCGTLSHEIITTLAAEGFDFDQMYCTFERERERRFFEPPDPAEESPMLMTLAAVVAWNAPPPIESFTAPLPPLIAQATSCRDDGGNSGSAGLRARCVFLCFARVARFTVLCRLERLHLHGF